MSEAAREAFRTALTGPVGTEATFDTQGAKLWKRVTVTHVANDTVDVAGGPRSAVELRVVRHDAEGRADVRAETLYAIDRATGVMLRCESVTPMADGEVTQTIAGRSGRSGRLVDARRSGAASSSASRRRQTMALSRTTRVNLLLGNGHFLSHFYALCLPPSCSWPGRRRSR